MAEPYKFRHDYFSGATFNDVKTLPETGQEARDAEELARSKAVAADANFSWGNLAHDVVSSTLTGQIMMQFGKATPLADPNWSFDDYKKRLEEASKVLPEEYLPALKGAHSEEHFNQLLTQAWAMQESKRRLQEAGWTGWTANMAADMLDPVGLALGIKTFQLGRRIPLAMGAGRAGQFVGNAAAGVAGTAGIELGKDMLGVPTDATDYLVAAGLGAALGGIFGPIASNPATRQEAAALTILGRGMMKKGAEVADGIRAKFAPKEPTQAAVERAAKPQDAALEIPKQEAASPAPVEVPKDITPPVAPDTAPSIEPLTPPEPGDGLSIVPQLRREGPDALRANILEYRRKFGDEALIAEARANGFKKIKPGDDIADQIIRAAENQILDRAAAAGSLKAKAQLDAQSAVAPEVSAAIREVVPPEVADVVEGTLAKILPEDAPQAPKAEQPKTTAEVVQRIAEKPDQPIPQETLQELADALDQVPTPAPGRARQLPTPKAMATNKYHIGEYEGADGKIYRIMSGEENGLGPYRVVDVSSKKVVLRDAPDINKARAAIPGGASDYNPAKAAIRAELMDAGMTPGPAPVPTEDGYKFRSFVIKRTDEGDGKKLLTSYDKDGTEIGYTELSDFGDGRWYVSDIRVEPEYRKGFGALSLMKSAEAELGGPMFPDGQLLPDGYEHWATRLPWVAEWYKKIPGGGTGYYSPRRLLVEIENAKQQLDAAIAGGDPKKIEKFKQIYEGRKQVWDELPADAKKPENLRQMFELRDEKPSPGKLNEEARADVERILQRTLPRQFTYKIEKTAFDGMMGSFDPVQRLVKVAIGGNSNPLRTAWHEVVHAMKQLGQFTQKEWDDMLRYARSQNAYERYKFDDYRAFYKAQNVDEAGINELLDEEAVAYTMGEYARGARVGGFAQSLYDRTILAFRSFKQALGLSKWNTEEKAFDSAFRRMRTGEISQRPQNTGPGTTGAEVLAQLDAGAAENEAALQPFLQDPAWKAVKDEDVPMSAGFWRFDRAGILGKRQNPLTRLIGTSLLNDTVGKADHSLNPFSADLDQIRILNTYMGEYTRYRGEAFQEWADSQQLSTWQRMTQGDIFYSQVGEYVAERNPGFEYHPAVKRLGDTVRRIQADIAEDLKNPLRREGLQGRSVKGAEDLETNFKYLWRKFDNDKVDAAIKTFGDEQVIKMVAGAIRSAQPDMPEDFLAKLSRGYVMGLKKRAVGLGDEWSIRLGEGNYDKFRKLLQEDTALTDGEIEDVIARLQVKPTEGGTMSNLKTRVFLDEGYAESGLVPRFGGEPQTLAFRHLLDNNIDRVFGHYARRASGRVALARVRIKAPRFDDLLVDGITSDAEWNGYLKLLKEYAADQRLDPRATEKDIEQLQFAFDRIVGNVDPAQMTDFARWARRVRQYNVSRLMGQVGIAQVGEAGTIVGTLGVKASFAHVPAFRRMITDAGESRLRNELFDEIEHIGIGVERLHGWGYQNLEDIGEMPFEVRRWDRGEIIDRNLKLIERGTYEMSGMSVIQQQQERATAAAVAQKIANMAVKPTPSRSDLKRMAQLGMDEAMLQRVMRGLREHADTTEGVLFGNRINRLNLQNWTDLQARAALEDAMFRMTRKLVQSGDIGNSAIWMSNPIWQTLFQFRSFTFTAWANQFLYNVHMRDFNAFATMLWSTSWAAAVRAMQVSVLASARSDGERWKEKQLDPWELGKAGFSRAGWSSIIPMTIDTGMTFAGQPGMFNARTTGQASDAVFGSPVTSFIDSAAKGIGGLVDSTVKGRSVSQAEARQAFGVLPFSNMIPMTMALSHLISDLPVNAPPKRRD